MSDLQIEKQGWYDDLSKVEVESINRGIKDHEKEEFLTSQEFWSDEYFGDYLKNCVSLKISGF